ncbi:MAG: right-handed parallel beta-helix repeat-containing protein [Verrucomicrobia bacterium]|nr:right-handed parallel beta-helix repeat-containing protein [Verrucomicrobiota bacterium]MBS0636904.1 right-handed parallel beta-helix repeat-containing protein [Verrucomicrobiota bacterium]
MKKLLFLLSITASLAADGFNDTCNQVNGQFSAISGVVSSSLPLDPLLIVNQLPCTIDQPGNYTVLRNLRYSGDGAAITVTSNNVSINFLNHTLTLNNAQAVGVYAQNVSEFILENQIVQGASLAAVHLKNVSKAAINNIYTANNPHGAFFENCDDVQLTSSQFSGDSGVSISSSAHVLIDTCTFNGTDNAIGLSVDGSSTDVIVSNSNFSNYLSTIFVGEVNGMVIDHCQATASSESNQNLIQLGTATTAATDIIIRNSSFMNSGSVDGFDGILALNGSGCLLEKVIVDNGSIHINGYEDLVANSCTVKGNTLHGIFIEKGSKIVFNESQISGATLHNIHMLDATSCLVKNCMIFDGTSGIYIDNSNGGGANSIRNSFIFNHVNTGITVADMAKNNISGNYIWGNDVGLDIASSYYTETFFNTSCNNKSQDCSNVYPSQQPGGTTSAVAGSNLCCS